ncbi:MAG: ATP-binding cassette domain-containing protein [Jatrophihabitans sp.]
MRAHREVSASAHAISRTYRVDRKSVQALDRVGKDFARGALTVIAGPSGSGKSSLLRILACVERPDTGYLEIAGESVAHVGPRRRRRLRRNKIGFIFQDPIDNLIEYLTAEEQVRTAARLRGAKATEAEIDALLDSLSLSDRRDHKPQQLSGGEQQRVSVACAMVGDPVLIVADEPTAELDSVSAGRVLDGIGVLCRGGGTFVIASHDPRVIERADHLLRLDHGTVAESW